MYIVFMSNSLNPDYPKHTEGVDFLVPPWHLGPQEIRKEIQNYIASHSELPENLPISKLTEGISLGHIFAGPLYDYSEYNNPKLAAKQDELLDLLDQTWRSLPKQAYDALYYWRRAVPIAGGYQQFILQNCEAIKEHYSQMRQYLQNRFGDCVYLWRGLARNIESNRGDPSSGQPLTSYSASWDTAIKFGSPMRLDSVPVEQIVAILHSDDDPSNSYQAEFIVDTRIRENQPLLTITPPLLSLLNHVRFLDFIHKEEHLKRLKQTFIPTNPC